MSAIGIWLNQTSTGYIPLAKRLRMFSKKRLGTPRSLLVDLFTHANRHSRTIELAHHRTSLLHPRGRIHNFLEFTRGHIFVNLNHVAPLHRKNDFLLVSQILIKTVKVLAKLIRINAGATERSRMNECVMPSRIDMAKSCREVIRLAPGGNHSMSVDFRHF